MLSKEMLSFLYKVITSWQIIAVTAALILYFSLVSYVARLYHPRRPGFSFGKKSKKEKPPAAHLPETTPDDDLGIE